MRYTLDQLIQRANAGNVGFRGLRRLQAAGVNPTELAGSGVASPLQIDPQAQLDARRGALYGRAVQAAHDLQPGQQLSAGLAHRLQLGPGGNMSQDTFAPHTASEVQSLTTGDHSGLYDAILGSIRKRAQGVGSTAGIYKL